MNLYTTHEAAYAQECLFFEDIYEIRILSCDKRFCRTMPLPHWPIWCNEWQNAG